MALDEHQRRILRGWTKELVPLDELDLKELRRGFRVIKATARLSPEFSHGTTMRMPRHVSPPFIVPLPLVHCRMTLQRIL